MQATKPKIRRVYVQAVNPDTGKSKGTTLYNTTEAEVIESLRKIAKEQDEKVRARHRGASASA